MALIDFLIRVGLDAREFTAGTKTIIRGLNTVGREAKSGFADVFKRHFGSFLSGAGFALFSERLLAMADQMDDLRKRTGIGVEALQELQFAADESGASLQDFIMATRMLTLALAGAERGGKAQLAAFDALGLSFDQMRQSSPEERLKLISDAMKDGALSTKQFDAARVLLGRGFDRVLPAMQEGLRGTAQQARELGQVIASDVNTQLAETHDALQRLQRSTTVLFAPAIAGLVEFSEKMIRVFRSGIIRHVTAFSFKESVSGVKIWRDAWQQVTKEMDAEESRRFTSPESARFGTQPAIAQAQTPSSAASVAPNMQAYESARIGLFVGGAFNPMIETALRQESKLDSINGKLSSIDSNIEAMRNEQ